MKLLLRRNISKLGNIGDVVEVKPGYGRNYLLPQGLAVVPTEANIRAIEGEKQRYLQELAKQREELQAKAALVHGKEITVPARANEEGHLYGSVGPAQIAAALAAENIFIEPQSIVLDEPIRRLDKYDLTVRFSAEVTATISVWVVPVRESGQEDDSPAPSPPADQTDPSQEAPDAGPAPMQPES